MPLSSTSTTSSSTTSTTSISATSTATITTITAATLCHPDIVYAKWRGRITNQQLPYDPPSYTDHYDVTIRPELPLAIGRVIKVWALSMKTHHVPVDHPTPPIQYATYDPQVEGRIVRVRSVEGNVVEFILENHIKDSEVSLACIAVPYLPNITARLDMMGRILKWLTVTKNQPHARFIHLESAVVVRTVTEFSPCPACKTGSVEKPTECSDEQSDEIMGTPDREEWEEEVDSEATCNNDWEDELECGILSL